MSPRCILLLVLVAIIGCGESTAPVSEVPLKPESVLTSARTEEITITWHDVSTNETGFRVEVRQGDGPWLLLRLTAPNVTSAVHPGVLFGETYHYRVAACNEAGCSEWVETSGKWQTGGPPEVISFRVTSIGAESAIFLANAISGGLPTRFQFVVYKIGEQFPVAFSPQITKTPSNVGGEVTGSVAADWQILTLEQNTFYRVALSVENDIGGAPTVIPLEFQTEARALPAISNLRMQNVSPGRVFLAATIDPGGLYTLYSVELIRDGGSYAQPVATFTGSVNPGVASGIASASFPNLQSGVTYRWRLVAENSQGRTISEEQSFILP